MDDDNDYSHTLLEQEEEHFYSIGNNCEGKKNFF